VLKCNVQNNPEQPQPPERDAVPVSIKTVQLDGSTKLLQCYCSAYLRFEAEYGLKRGTTSNAYLLLDGTEGVLVDVPRKEYLEVFCTHLHRVVSHAKFNRVF
jgi:flavorubredoxin